MRLIATIILQGLFFSQSPSVQTDSNVEYFCDPIVWVETVHRDPVDDYFKGSVESTCTYRALAGGNLRNLESYLHVKIRNDSAIIHTGPSQRTWRGKSATFYDATMDYGTDRNRFSVRQEIFFSATPDTLAMLSKSIRVDPLSSGTFLRATEFDTVVNSTKAAEWFRVRVLGTFSLEKPWYIPAPIFRDQVTTKIQESSVQTQINLVTELASHT